MFLVAFAGTAVAGYGLVLLRRTWAETKRTADVTREIGEAQVRAYLRISQVMLGPEGGKVKLAVECVNDGQSPCSKVEAVYGISTGDRRQNRHDISGSVGLHNILARDKRIGPFRFSQRRFPERLLQEATTTTITIAVFALDVFGREITPTVSLCCWTPRTRSALLSKFLRRVDTCSE